MTTKVDPSVVRVKYMCFVNFINCFIIKSLLLEAKGMFEHQYFQMFCLKYNKYEQFSSKLWVAVARHNFEWGKFKNENLAQVSHRV